MRLKNLDQGWMQLNLTSDVTEEVRILVNLGLFLENATENNQAPWHFLKTLMA